MQIDTERLTDMFFRTFAALPVWRSKCSGPTWSTEVISLKGDSYRLKDRDLGRVRAATKAND